MYLATWTATGGYEPRRMPNSAHPSIVPFQAFATADGWITIACAKQKFWERLCEVLDRRDLLEDPRFADFAARGAHRDELVPEIAAMVRRRTTREWTRILLDAGVPNGPVYEVAQALEDPHTLARGDVVEIDHPRFGTVRQVASPLRLSGASAPLRRAPLRGEHTDQVLLDVCGYSAEHVAQLRAAGVFGVVGDGPAGVEPLTAARGGADNG